MKDVAKGNQMKHLTDKRLIEAAKEVLRTHYFKSDEDFLKWALENYYYEALENYYYEALENYYYEALNRKEFAREFVANGYWAA